MYLLLTRQKVWKRAQFLSSGIYLMDGKFNKKSKKGTYEETLNPERKESYSRELVGGKGINC